MVSIGRPRSLLERADSLVIRDPLKESAGELESSREITDQLRGDWLAIRGGAGECAERSAKSPPGRFCGWRSKNRIRRVAFLTSICRRNSRYESTQRLRIYGVPESRNIRFVRAGWTLELCASKSGGWMVQPAQWKLSTKERVFRSAGATLTIDLRPHCSHSLTRVIFARIFDQPLNQFTTNAK